MQKKILIVEDEAIVALDIQNHLEKTGYEVAGTFATGESALKSISGLNPDLVLMDIKLAGEMDGLETARKIRIETGKPVILLTAYTNDLILEKVKGIDPFGYVLKPFDRQELKTAVEMALYRYRMETELQKSEEKYRRLFEDDLSGNFLSDSSGRIYDWNSSFADMFKFENREEIAGANVVSLFSDPEEYRTLRKELDNNGKLKLKELHLLTTERNNLIVLANIIPDINKSSGELDGFKWYLIDITDRKKLEGQFRQSQKLEAVGRLAGGLAHDFNNILTVILGYTTMISEKIADDIPVDSDITGIKNAAQKASRLTRQLLTLSRRQATDPDYIDINNHLQDMSKMIRRLIPENVVISFFPDAENSVVYMDPGQLEQVVLNLVVNARDAMPEGGLLLLRTSEVDIIPGTVFSSGEIPKGSYICLSVEDKGVGIDDDIVEKIFDPFFTTKPKEIGTGLGLSTVWGIVERNKGFIEVDSEADQGTVFRIYLPHAADIKLTKKIEAPEVTEINGGETVLVVEDDDIVRSLIVKMLNRQGYTVLEADNPGEALLICESYTGKIDLLVSDLIMPHINGDRLFERLKKLIPGIKVLIISGYAIGEVEENGVYEFNSEDFISKPFEPLQFLFKVREILDR